MPAGGIRPEAFELASATDTTIPSRSAARSIAPVSREQLDVERGRVRVDHSGLDLRLTDPVTRIALEVQPSRFDAVIELGVFQGEHRIGSQLFGFDGKSSAGVTAADDGWVGLISDQPFDRVRIRNVHAPDGRADFEIGMAAIGTHTRVGTGNDIATACQAPLGIVHNVAFGAALVPGTGVIASAAAYASNLALKYCLTWIEPPPDKFRRIPAGECEATFRQPHMVSKYENALGISIGYNSDWGDLGSPSVYHHNTEVDVALLYDTPAPRVSTRLDLAFWAQGGSLEATDRIWEQCQDDGSVRFSQLDGAGPMYECPYAAGRDLAIPVGERVLRWRVNARMSPLDLFGPLIPGVPAGAKQNPWRGLLINVIREAILIANDAVFFSGWRIDNSRDVFQFVTVYDEVPPEIQPQPMSTARIAAQLVGNEIQVTIEADEPGGVSARNYERILKQMYEVSDACGRDMSFSSGYPEPNLRVFWPVSTPSSNETFEITWTARDPGPNLDGERNETTTTMTVEVVDIQPPVIVPPPDIVEVGTGQVNDLGQPLVFDFVDLDPSISNDASLPLTTGLHEITWTATDASGNTDSAVQIVNIKNSNLAPTALAQTGPDRQVAVSFEPQTIRIEGSDPDADPLTFYVEQYPQDGFFVAPLYPYFVEDYRLQQSISDDALEDLCTNGPDAPDGRFELQFPSQPRHITVNDQGHTFVADWGSINCNSGLPGNFERERRLARFNADGSLHARASMGDFNVHDMVFDVNSDLIVVTSVNEINSHTVVTVFDAAITPLQFYSLANVVDTNGNCIPIAFGDCRINHAKSTVFDELGLFYVMDYTGRIFVLEEGEEPGDAAVFIDYLSVDVDDAGATWVDADSLALDSKGYVYASRNDRIYKYEPAELNAEGQVVPGDLVGWMGRCDIDAAPGDAAVCDTRNRRTIGYSCTDETCLIDDAITQEEKDFCGWTFADPGHFGCRPGQFRDPRGIDIDPRDNLYVADYANERIQRFTPDGFFAGEAESSCDGSCFILGDFGQPRDVSVNSDHFYILDPYTNLVHVSQLTPFTEIGPDYAELIYQSDNEFACVDSADCIDSFAFSVSDGVRHPDTGLPIRTAPADVEVEVLRNFRSPIATPGIAIGLFEDEPTSVTLYGSDPDPLDTLTYAIDQPAAHGTIDLNGDQATYTPETDYYGSDSFSFTVSDGSVTSEPEDVLLTVVEVNDPPVILMPDSVTVGEGFAYRLDLEFTDPDPDEQHWLTIDWGDGTFEQEGILDSSGNITGPLVSQSGVGTGKISGIHVYSSSGTRIVEVCLTDRVTGDDGSEVPTTDSLTACETFPVEVIEGLDLVMLLGFGATERALPNQLFEVTFQVLNEPPAAGPPTTATGVELIVDLPQGLAPGSILVSGSHCALDELQVTCNVGTLDPGFQGWAQITARVDSATPPGTALAFEARASADQIDVNPDNAIAHVINVAQPADLYVDAVDDAFRDKPDIDPGDGDCESEDGVCTLRAAIEEANAQPGLRTVALGTGVYTLTEGAINVTDDLLLVGNGAARSLIDGNNSGSAFRVTDEFVTLRIENLTLTRGSLFVSGDLVVRRSRFTGTTSGSGAGGAIQASNLIDIRDTTFDDNRSESGGAVWGNSGSHGVFENITVVGHTGGGLTLAGTDYTLNHVTMTGNVGDSGAASGVAGGALTLFGNTTATITGSILAGNYPVGSGVIDRPINCAVGSSATLISGGDNLLGDLDGCDLAPGPTDLLVADTATGLRPLRFGAGPLPFVPPAPGSPAIDIMLGMDCPAFDARGIARPVDGDGDGMADCDIGAIEFVPELAPPQLFVSSTAIDFGEVAPGDASQPATASLSNTGEQPLVIESMTVFGAAAADFSLPASDNACSDATLDPDQECSFEVVFTPQQNGVRTARVLIQSSDPDGSRVIDLTGTSGVLFADGFEGD